MEFNCLGITRPGNDRWCCRRLCCDRNRHLREASAWTETEKGRPRSILSFLNDNIQAGLRTTATPFGPNFFDTGFMTEQRPLITEEPGAEMVTVGHLSRHLSFFRFRNQPVTTIPVGSWFFGQGARAVACKGSCFSTRDSTSNVSVHVLSDCYRRYLWS